MTSHASCVNAPACQSERQTIGVPFERMGSRRRRLIAVCLLYRRRVLITFPPLNAERLIMRSLSPPFEAQSAQISSGFFTFNFEMTFDWRRLSVRPF